jgi:hypothetical protein
VKRLITLQPFPLPSKWCALICGEHTGTLHLCIGHPCCLVDLDAATLVLPCRLRPSKRPPPTSASLSAGQRAGGREMLVDMPPSHGLFGKDWGRVESKWDSCVWSEQVPDGVSCSASSRTSLTGVCTVRVMAHARRAQNAFSVARRLNCKSLLLLLTTDMSARRHECIQATASSLRCACPLASASPPTPLNQFGILHGALQRMRLNTAFLRHVTICDMTLQAPICVDSGCLSSSRLAGYCDLQQHISRVHATLSVKTILLLYHRARHRFHI